MKKKVKKVKIFKIIGASYWDPEDTERIISEETEWEEIDEALYYKLEKFVRTKNSEYSKNRINDTYVLVEDPNQNEIIASCIADYEAMIKVEEEKQAKKAESLRKRMITRKKNKEKKELAQLERLRIKYEKEQADENKK